MYRTPYGYLGGGSSSSSTTTGQRGPPGIGVESIDTIDNNDGTVQLTFNMSDSSTIVTSNNLVSDTLIALDELSITGTNKSHKLSVQNNVGTQLLIADTISDKVYVNPNLIVHKAGNAYIELEMNKITFGNLTYEAPAYLSTASEGVISVSGRLSQSSAPTTDSHLVNKLYVDENDQAAQTTANTAITNASTAQTTADTAITNASTAQTTADTAITNASTAQSSATTAIGYLNQNVKTTSSPAFVSLQLPSTQTSPSLVSGKMVLGTNPGGDLVAILPSGKVCPIVGQTMPFFSFDQTVTAVIYTEPSANMFSIIWDSTYKSAGISFVSSTYYGGDTINVSSHLIRRSTAAGSMLSGDSAGLGFYWVISAGATMFLATANTTAPVAADRMTSSGMLLRSEIYPNIVSTGGLPYPVFRITIRTGSTGSSCNIRWLYT